MKDVKSVRVSALYRLAISGGKEAREIARTVSNLLYLTRTVQAHPESSPIATTLPKTRRKSLCKQH
jgi:hypothetical protein